MSLKNRLLTLALSAYGLLLLGLTFVSTAFAEGGVGDGDGPDGDELLLPLALGVLLVVGVGAYWLRRRSPSRPA